SRRRHLREGLHRVPGAAASRRHARLHVREPLPLPPHPAGARRVLPAAALRRRLAVARIPLRSLEALIRWTPARGAAARGDPGVIASSPEGGDAVTMPG